MAQVDDDPLHEVMELFFLCGYEMQRTAAAEWGSLELTAAQLKVLFTLVFEGQATIGTIAHTLNISPPTASHLVDRLVQAGLAERVEHSTDRRYTLAHPTSQGGTLVRRCRLDHLQSWLAQLDEPDLAALRQGLKALLHVMQLASSPRSGGDREEVAR
jgi:DNA-binding MarR family transcriptional regulator